MKTNFLPSVAAGIALAGTMALAPTVLAQDSTQTTAVQVAPPATAAPPLAYGVSQILQLSQAKVDDGIIISYIKNSGNSYGLNADQIIYLRQQGISTGVINAMLSQPAPGVIAGGGSGVPMPSSPAPQVSYQQPPPQNTGMVGPSVSGIDPSAAAAANYYYYQPTYYPYYSYPGYYPAYGYGFYPGVSFGWGGRWGGWRGGWGGGWRGGGGFHGGGGWHR